jgi:2'-5' RNA ligase
MDTVLSEGGGINSFSLVAYLPEPLAAFVDDLRLELQPGCEARGHVTLLPPRPILTPLRQAIDEIAGVLCNEYSFDVELAQVCVFPASSVLHLSIGQGSSTLIRLHRLLNRGACEHTEMFYFHPHVTAGQGLGSPEEVADAMKVATARWQAYRGPRSFTVERTNLVQNTVDNGWRNMQEFELQTAMIRTLG